MNRHRSPARRGLTESQGQALNMIRVHGRVRLGRQTMERGPGGDPTVSAATARSLADLGLVSVEMVRQNFFVALPLEQS